jgi:metal-responsive CopG/Arc/MetJ family transcriptional regulator
MTQHSEGQRRRSEFGLTINLAGRYNRGHTMNMKTAISLPDEIFEAAEHLAERLGVSRSHLYARALAEYVAHHQNCEVTAKLDEVYSTSAAAVEQRLNRLQFHSVGGDEW